jgi:hypothetical protein
MTKLKTKKEGQKAILPNPVLPAVWREWMRDYPSKNGLYLVVPRGKNETWVGYWNDAMRRFEEAVPEFTDRGIDVDWWAELPLPPNCR